MTDLSKFCRVCLSDLATLSKLESYSIDIPSMSLREIFYACTQISTSSEREEKMCRSCQNRMVKAYEFRVQAHKSEHIMRTKMGYVKPDSESQPLLKPPVPDFFDAFPDPSVSDDDYDNDSNSVPLPAIEPEVVMVKTEIKEEPMDDDDVEVLEEPVVVAQESDGPKEKAKKKRKKKNDHPNRYCDYCLVYIENQKERRKHVDEHILANGGLECDLCEDRKFSTKLKLWNHMRTGHIKRIKKKYLLGNNGFPCTMCEKSYETEIGLDAHIQRSHKTENGKDSSFICHYCAREFKTKNSMKGHISSVHEKKTKVHIGSAHEKIKVSCDICFKQLSSSDALKDHMRLHTGERPHKCQVCGKTFAQRSTLRTHLDTHMEDKFYECEICGEKFKRKRLVKLHKAVHSDVFNYPCHLCEQKFRHRATLVNHLETHLDPEQRVVVCEVCGEPVKNKRLMRIHMRIHREGYFKCNFCEKEYKTSTALNEHIEVKHMGKKYYCPICAQPFSDFSSCRAHERHVHAGVPRPKTIRKTPVVRDRAKENARRRELKRLRRGTNTTKKEEKVKVKEQVKSPIVVDSSSSSAQPSSLAAQSEDQKPSASVSSQKKRPIMPPPPLMFPFSMMTKMETPY